MTEATKLYYLFKGLRPSLFEKVWVRNQPTCRAFLAEIKLQSEAAVIAGQTEWPFERAAMAVTEKVETKRGVYRVEPQGNSRPPTPGIPPYGSEKGT